MISRAARHGSASGIGPGGETARAGCSQCTPGDRWRLDTVAGPRSTIVRDAGLTNRPGADIPGAAECPCQAGDPGPCWFLLLGSPAIQTAAVTPSTVAWAATGSPQPPVCPWRPFLSHSIRRRCVVTHTRVSLPEPMLCQSVRRLLQGPRHRRRIDGIRARVDATLSYLLTPPSDPAPDRDGRRSYRAAGPVVRVTGPAAFPRHYDRRGAA